MKVKHLIDSCLENFQNQFTHFQSKANVLIAFLCCKIYLLNWLLLLKISLKTNQLNEIFEGSYKSRPVSFLYGPAYFRLRVIFTFGLFHCVCCYSRHCCWVQRWVYFHLLCQMRLEWKKGKKEKKKKGHVFSDF